MIPWKSLVDLNHRSGGFIYAAYDSRPMVALNSFTSPIGVSTFTCGKKSHGSVQKPDPLTDGAESLPQFVKKRELLDTPARRTANSPQYVRTSFTGLLPCWTSTTNRP